MSCTAECKNPFTFYSLATGWLFSGIFQFFWNSLKINFKKFRKFFTFLVKINFFWCFRFNGLLPTNKKVQRAIKQEACCEWDRIAASKAFETKQKQEKSLAREERKNWENFSMFFGCRSWRLRSICWLTHAFILFLDEFFICVPPGVSNYSQPATFYANKNTKNPRHAKTKENWFFQSQISFRSHFLHVSSQNSS